MGQSRSQVLYEPVAAENNLGPDRPGGNHDTVEHLGTVKHLDTAALQAGLGHIRESPPDHGTVEMIVRRPAVDEREVLAVGTLDVAAGLAGDTWQARGSTRAPDGSANPAMQLTVMNSRAALLVAQEADRRTALRRPRPQPRQPAGGHPARRGLGGHPGERRTTPRLRQVRRAVRPGRVAVRQLPDRPRAAAARPERADRRLRLGPPRRQDPQAARLTRCRARWLGCVPGGWGGRSPAGG